MVEEAGSKPGSWIYTIIISPTATYLKGDGTDKD
jgi:hypothetical protein